ncbi:MAG TPA: GNAT family N-acetyltransferase [Dissulfurispiraceae bacterium]
MSTLVYYHRKIHFVLLSGDLNEPPPVEGDEIRLVTKKDIPLLSSMYRSEQVYLRRLQNGYSAIICIRGGKAVHMEWFCRSHYYIWDGRVTLDPGPGGYYLFDLYTKPEFRGRGIWRLAMRRLLDHIRNTNSDPVLFSAVDYLNHSALRAHLKNGFSGLGMLEFKQVCGLRKWSYRHRNGLPDDFEWGFAGVHNARLSYRENALRLGM